MSFEWNEPMIMIGILIFCVIGAGIQDKIGKIKAKSGEDKKIILDIVHKKISDAETYSVVYATYKLIYGARGGRIITDYWYYALAFKEDILWVIPLSSVDKGMYPGKPFCLSPKNIETIELTKPWVTFFNEKREEILRFSVHEEYTFTDKFAPMNIEQKEEAQKFFEFIEEFVKSNNEDIHTHTDDT